MPTHTNLLQPRPGPSTPVIGVPDGPDRLLHDVQHLLRLSEDKRLVPPVLPVLQELDQDAQFTTPGSVA